MRSGDPLISFIFMLHIAVSSECVSTLSKGSLTLSI